MHTGRAIVFEISHIRTFQTSMILTLDQVIGHTVVYQSSTSIYIADFLQIRTTFVDGQTDIKKDFISRSRDLINSLT